MFFLIILQTIFNIFVIFLSPRRAHSKTSSRDHTKQSPKKVKWTKTYWSDATERWWAECSRWAPKINRYVVKQTGKEQKEIRCCSRLWSPSNMCTALDWLQESLWLNASHMWQELNKRNRRIQSKSTVEANFKPTAQVSIKCDTHQSYALQRFVYVWIRCCLTSPRTSDHHSTIEKETKRTNEDIRKIA